MQYIQSVTIQEVILLILAYAGRREYQTRPVLPVDTGTGAEHKTVADTKRKMIKTAVLD